jgi:hypothetical protein
MARHAMPWFAMALNVHVSSMAIWPKRKNPIAILWRALYVNTLFSPLREGYMPTKLNKPAAKASQQSAKQPRRRSVPAFVRRMIDEHMQQPEMKKLMHRGIVHGSILIPSDLDKVAAQKLEEQMEREHADLENGISRVLFGKNPKEGFRVLIVKRDGTAVKLSSARLNPV